MILPLLFVCILLDAVVVSVVIAVFLVCSWLFQFLCSVVITIVISLPAVIVSAAVMLVVSKFVVVATISGGVITILFTSPLVVWD